MKIFQQTISLRARKRGFHLITEEVETALPELLKIELGMCLVFIQHT